MGRDWAPFEHYMSEQRLLKEHGDLFDFLDGLKFVHTDGREEIVNPPEEMAIRRQFPQLGRLLMDDFMELHKKLSAIPGGIDFLHKKDNELATFLKAGRIVNPNTNEYILKVDDIEGIDEDSYLVKWFAGRLDEHFYYSERNNELFVECMVGEATVLAREPFDKARFETALEHVFSDADSYAAENRDFYEAYAEEFVYCCENNKDLLDFDFWTRYELLVGEKLSWDEYVAIDNSFDGDPLDVSFSDRETIESFRDSLNNYRSAEKGKASLDEKISEADGCVKQPEKNVSDRDREER